MKKIYIIISLIVIVILVLGYGTNKKYGFFQTSEDAKRIYKQGLEALENNDLQNAYFNFSKVSQFNTYYETALFHQGLIATELNDDDSAIIAYETLLEKFPNTFFREKSIYNLAIAYFNKGMKEQAYANFQLIAKKYANSDYADASNYFLGVLIKDENKQKAVEHFINYIKIAPTGKYALSSIDELLAMDVNFTSAQNFIIGSSLLENNKNEKALEFLNKSRFDEAWAYLSVAYKNTNNKKLSKQLFEKGLEKYTKNNDEFQQKALEEYIDTLALGRERGLREVKTQCDKVKCQLNDYIMYNLLSYSDSKTKKEYYNRIYEEFPQGNYAADALYNSLFNDYLEGSYDNAIIKAKKHISKYSDKKSAPAAMFWLAKTYDKKRNHQEANNYYNKVYTKYSDSYYAYLSAMKLNKISNPYEIKNTAKLPQEPVYVALPIIHANLPINASKKIDMLLQAGDYKIFEFADFDNEIIRSWVAYYNGDYTRASVIAEKVLEKASVKPTFDDDIYKLVYPIAYSDMINEAASKDSKIQPYLLISLIRKESRFNPDALSSTGAMGLTQLMPATAQFIANLSGVKYDKSKVFEPQYNIDLGVKYYNYIKKNHHSLDLYALASYNGGHGSVEQWKAKFNTNDLEEFVEKIPYPETKDYVKQIYAYYWVYNCIYNSARVR